MKLLSIVLLALVAVASVSAQESTLSTAEVREHSVIDEATIRGHLRFLADDLLEGRGPGSRGDDLTQLYLATQFQTLGLNPAAADGT